MNMNNLQIAKAYGKQIKSTLALGGQWISWNSNLLSAKELKKVLVIYNKMFSKVEYNPELNMITCTR